MIQYRLAEIKCVKPVTPLNISFPVGVFGWIIYIIAVITHASGILWFFVAVTSSFLLFLALLSLPSRKRVKDIKSEIQAIRNADATLLNPVPIDFSYLVLGVVYSCIGIKGDSTYIIETYEKTDSEVNKFLVKNRSSLRVESPFEGCSLPVKFRIDQKMGYIQVFILSQ